MTTDRRQQVPRTCIVMAGHFPPPVHGMAVAFSRLADVLEGQATVVRIRTSPNSLHASASYHGQRIGRVAGAVVRLAWLRRRARTVLLSVDAGAGMLYVIALALVARALRYETYLQHHSYAYLNSRTWFMRLLALAAGPSTHLCSCPAMTTVLSETYPSIRNVRTLPLAYAVAVPAESLPNRAADRPRLRVGHFGNLTIAKGLDIALRTVAQLRAADCPVELHLAGPLAGSAEQDLVAAAVDDHPGDVVYAGPLYGRDRDRFLADIDVLLFPSRYSHESFGLALWESLAAGTPAIAYRAGCLTPEATIGAAVVLEHGADFVTEATPHLRRWATDGAALAEASTAARALAQNQIRTAERAVDEFATAVAGVAAC